MLIHHDPDEWESISEHHVCPYHQAHPDDVAWPGCTCSSSFGSRRRAPEEVARIKAEKRREREDKILAEAEVIRCARSLAKQEK